MSFIPLGRDVNTTPQYCTYCGRVLVEHVKQRPVRWDAVSGKPNQWLRDFCCPKHIRRSLWGYVGLVARSWQLIEAHDYWFEFIDNDPSALPRYVPARLSQRGE